MLMSLAVVFFGMQLMMVGPLKGRLDGIQTRLDLADQNIRQLVGTQGGVLEANSLLSSLEEQSDKLSDVRTAVDDIAALRIRLEREADSATTAITELDRMVELQQRVIAARPQTESAVIQVAQLEALRDQIISGSGQTEVADNSFNGMLALQKRVIAASNGYEEASVSIANLADLTQRLIESDNDLQVASERFDSFIGLQNRMIAAAEDTKAAEESVRTLVAMNETLGRESQNLGAASGNLDQMMVLQEKLAQQTTRVADAIQNLELMDDFQGEVSTHIRSLTNLRRTLMELAMMETTVGRVAQVIAPLAEIGNLRRLSESEVRDAARVILDQRNTRLSRTGQPSSSGSAEHSNAESAHNDLVPLPPEGRHLQ